MSLKSRRKAGLSNSDNVNAGSESLDVDRLCSEPHSRERCTARRGVVIIFE